jgi:hypothetical protein
MNFILNCRFIFSTVYLHAAFFFTICLQLLAYLIYLRICNRRFYNKLRALPHKHMPVGRDILSRHMHRVIIDSFARISNESFQPLPIGAHPYDSSKPFKSVNGVLKSEQDASISFQYREAILEIGREYQAIVRSSANPSAQLSSSSIAPPSGGDSSAAEDDIQADARSYIATVMQRANDFDADLGEEEFREMKQAIAILME